MQRLVALSAAVVLFGLSALPALYGKDNTHAGRLGESDYVRIREIASNLDVYDFYATKAQILGYITREDQKALLDYKRLLAGSLSRDGRIDAERKYQQFRLDLARRIRMEEKERHEALKRDLAGR